MTLHGTAQRLTILLGESQTWHRRPLYHEVIARAHKAGLAGASVFRGIEGYGASNHIHSTRILSLSEDLPLKICIVDRPERIQAFLPTLEEVLGDNGLVIIDEVQVVRHPGLPPRGDSPLPADGRTGP